MLGLIVLIIVSQCGSTPQIFFSFHILVPSWNRSAILRFFVSSVAGPIGCCWELRLSNGSSQTRIVSPFPTTHPIFSFNRSLPIKAPRHPCELADFPVTSIKLCEWQYFPSKILDKIRSGLLWILHSNLPRKASLKAWKSRKPSLPISFGFVIFV